MSLLQRMVAKERVEREKFLPFQRVHGWSNTAKDNDEMARWRQELRGDDNGESES